MGSVFWSREGFTSSAFILNDFTNSVVNNFTLAIPLLPLLKKEAFPGRGEKVSTVKFSEFKAKEDIYSSFKSHVTQANVT